ncbi:nucleoporin nup49 nsp49 protein [Rutstroemia sp. NJR-2017a BBW]|nr:nucleoporin nup49 nsp49 protein [Rutstroemia sp. NJR-2017a BBW]
MAFAKAGGLSINTNSANSIFGSSTTSASTGGMFGNTQASKPLFGAIATTSAPQSGGLFGATTTSAPAAGGLFGTTTTATTAPQTGGLFGATAATSAPQSGGLFGSTAATSAPQSGGLFGATQAQSGGLFGNTNTNTSQPASTGGGLFGATTATPAQPQTGGLFGSTATNNTQQQGQPGGLFGGLGQNTNNQTAGASTNTGGLFGNSTATSQPAQNGGLFGGLNQNQNKAATPSLFGATQNQQNQAQQPQQSNNLFGGGLNQTQGSNMLGGSRLGGGLNLGSQSQQAQVVPGVRIDVSQMRGTTRFNDLHEDLQKQIMHYDNVIQAQITMKNDCEAIMPKHAELLSHVPNDVEFCRRKLIGMEDAMETDAAKIAQVRELIKEDVEHAKLSFRAIDNLKLPAQYHTPGIWASKSTSNPNGTQSSESDAPDLVSFFSSTADELEVTLQKYQRNFTEIEAHLRSLEASTAQQTQAIIAKRNGRSTAQENPTAELAAALFEFEQSIMGVAGRIGSAREGVQALQLGTFTGPTDLRASVNGGRKNGVY